MHYLVDMTLASHTKTPQEGIEFITVYVLPTLAAAKELEAKGIIVAGGLKTGQIAVQKRLEDIILMITSGVLVSLISLGINTKPGQKMRERGGVVHADGSL